MSNTIDIQGEEFETRALTTEKDMEALLAFEDHYFNSDTPSDNHPPRFTREEFEQGFKEGALMKGFFVDGEMVAYYWFDLKPESSELYVGNIVIKPEYRGYGLGQFIMTESEKVAKEHNLSKCTLTVDPFNGRGVHVYLKSGYRVIEFQPDKYGPGSDRFWMVKDLNSSNEEQPIETVNIEVNDKQRLLELLSKDYQGIQLIKASEEQYPDPKERNKHNYLILAKYSQEV